MSTTDAKALTEAQRALANAEQLVASLRALELAADDVIIRAAGRELSTEAHIIVRRMRNIVKWLETGA